MTKGRQATFSRFVFLLCLSMMYSGNFHLSVVVVLRLTEGIDRPLSSLSLSSHLVHLIQLLERPRCGISIEFHLVAHTGTERHILLHTKAQILPLM